MNGRITKGEFSPALYNELETFLQHLEQDATTDQKGHVQLSNDINSISETEVPTMKIIGELKESSGSNSIKELGGDPNAPDKSLILTNHANGPVANVYFYIQTVEFNSAGNMNYFQTAVGYNRNVMYTRFKYWENTNWSAWSLVYNTVTSLVSSTTPSTALFEGYEVKVYV